MLGSIVQNASDLIVLVLLFSFTIFVHELGHFLLALKCGMHVDTFSIGFGPAIWKKKIKGITYKISWIPLGGYVALPQLDPEGMRAVQSSDGEQTREPLPPISAWKKILVSFAGAGGNLVFAFLLAWIIYIAPDVQTASEDTGAFVGFVQTNSVAYERGLRMGDEIVAVNGEDVTTWNDVIILSAFGADNTNGVTLTLRSDGGARNVTVPTVDAEMDMPMLEGIARSMLCIVHHVAPDSPAAEAGLQAGDIIRECNGQPVLSTEHFIELVADRAGIATPLVLEREGERIERDVVPRYDEELDRALIGVNVSPGLQSGVTQWMQYRRPLDQIKGDAAGIFRILRALVTPREAKQAAKGLGGPIMIMTALWVSIKISLLNAIGFIRFLNVNLAILNLLPIPVLDGGHILFALWEGITRRRINARVVNILVNVFMALLLGVFVLLSFRDVLRIPSLLRAFTQDTEVETQEETAPEPESSNQQTAPDAPDPGR